MIAYYILFRSRAEVMNFSQILLSYGVSAAVVSAPSCIATSCSLAVRLTLQELKTAENILLRRSFSGFTGIYEVTQPNGLCRSQSRKIY